mgnify:CR=1 FL=1|jgi:hypothetical protein
MNCFLYPFECFNNFLLKREIIEYPKINQLSISLHKKQASITQLDIDDWELTSP